MTVADLSIPFGLGLVSSLHCVQMCGPLVLAWSLPVRRSGRPVLWAHLAYNAGRILTYALLGAVAGAVGGGIASLGRMAGVERAATIVSGLAMLAAGLLMSGWLPQSGLVQIGAAVPSRLSRAARNLFQSPAASSKLALGAVLGFLPCGLVYVALLKAVDGGSASAGALSMAAFGAGTSASLLGIGAFSAAISGRFGRHANTVASVCALFLGAYLVWRGIMAPAPSAGCHHGHAS